MLKCILLSLLLLCLVSCFELGEEILYIKIDPESDPSSPRFFLSNESDFSGDAAVGGVTVYSTDLDRGWRGPAWAIHHSSGLRRISEITYGVVPSGFSETAELHPLEVEVRHELSVWGAGEFPDFCFVVAEEGDTLRVREIACEDIP